MPCSVLVLGGTQFIGRHIVSALIDAGHEVTVFTRGRTPDALPSSVNRLHGDRNSGQEGLGTLAGRSWDACIDVSGYTPRQVRSSAALLRNSVGRYLFVSTVSVYQDSDDLPVGENHPVVSGAAEEVTEVTPATYGPLKVTCERVVGDIYGARATILRPQVVAGPYDPTGRHTYWIQRAMLGGDMLAPGDGTDIIQVVDARDIAQFARRAIEEAIGGIFNMAGPSLTWRAFIQALGADPVTWVPAGVIEETGLTSRELPLFLPNDSPRRWIMHISAARASDDGFTASDPERTIADTRAWLRDHPIALALPPEKEREVLARHRPQ